MVGDSLEPCRLGHRVDIASTGHIIHSRLLCVIDRRLLPIFGCRGTRSAAATKRHAANQWYTSLAVSSCFGSGPATRSERELKEIDLFCRTGMDLRPSQRAVQPLRS